ncbi:N-alpha-acetyltransferase [Acrasis kona]|uniref:N-alpha-acetyltransferase 60 n=1 Tax=Acrasis kona TaxID=1008807 RepID=A0AAW2ZG41_9EUKA
MSKVQSSQSRGYQHIKSKTKEKQLLSSPLLPPQTSHPDQHDNRDVIEEDTGYVFRTIRSEDLQPLRVLQLELFPVKYTKQFYLNLLDRAKTYSVLTIDRCTGKVIGVCSARVYEEVEFSWCGFNKKSMVMGYIMTLGVCPSHRRRGLASKMLDMLERRMLLEPYNVTRLTLHCKVDNNQALSFYKTLGFHVSQKIKNYYDFNGRYEDAYQLVRDAILEEHACTNVTIEAQNTDADNVIVPSFISQSYLAQIILEPVSYMTSSVARKTFRILDFCRNIWTPGSNRYYIPNESAPNSVIGGLILAFQRFLMTRDVEDEHGDKNIDKKGNQLWTSVSTAKKRSLSQQSGDLVNQHDGVILHMVVDDNRNVGHL